MKLTISQVDLSLNLANKMSNCAFESGFPRQVVAPKIIGLITITTLPLENLQFKNISRARNYLAWTLYARGDTFNNVRGNRHKEKVVMTRKSGQKLMDFARSLSVKNLRKLPVNPRSGTSVHPSNEKITIKLRKPG
jgi:hypothetical protein